MKKKIITLITTCFITALLVGCHANQLETNQESDSTNTQASSVRTILSDVNKEYGTTFGQGNVIDVKVEFSEEEWEDIKANAEQEEYHSANITVNGIALNNVGFRVKGFSSLNSVASSDSDRYGFKIKTDEYIEGQTLNGLDMFVLNGSFSDPSYMREYLTYLASAHLQGITPYVTYTNLYINNELFGFYLMIEAYDDSFVERNTKDKDAVLYKAESENCTLLSNDDASGFDISYGKDEGNSNVKNLITTLNNLTEENKEEFEEIFDVDSALKAWAINTVMGNYDSYSGSKAHNYYLLYSNRKFSYIGWDYNMSMGGFNEDNGASVTVDISSPIYNVDASKRPLIEKLLGIDEYNQKYLGYVNSLVTYFESFDSMVDEISNVISEYVSNDASAFYTYEQYQENIVASDADLSQVQAHIGGNGGNMTPPSMPDGQTPPDMPDSAIPSNMPDGQTMPQDGGTDQQDRQPRGQQGEKPRGDGGMISINAVSIVDYITQRIEFLSNQ